MAFIIIALNSCNYEQYEKYAIVSGIVEDETETKSIAREDCTTFVAPSIPSTVSSGGLKVNMVIIQITFEGSTTQPSFGDPFAQQSFKSNTNCWANKIFDNGSGQLNEYWQEVSSGKFMLYPAEETHGTVNDGIISVSFSGNHPNFGKDVHPSPWFTDALKKADPYIDFSKYDNFATNTAIKGSEGVQDTRQNFDQLGVFELSKWSLFTGPQSKKTYNPKS